MSGHRSIFIEVLQVVKIIFLLPFLTLPTDGQIFYSMKLIGVLCGGTVADQSVDAAHPAPGGYGRVVAEALADGGVPRRHVAERRDVLLCILLYPRPPQQEAASWSIKGSSLAEYKLTLTDTEYKLGSAG